MAAAIGKHKRMSVKALRLNGTDVATAVTGATLNLLSGLTSVGADLNLVSGLAAQGVSSVPKVAKVALGVVGTAGGCFAWANPEVGAIIVTRVVIDVTTVATAAGTLSVGQAANGTTSSANLIDTLDVNAATGTFDNVGSPGTLGKAVKKVAAGAYVTGSKASGALTGLVGSAYIHYISA